MLKIRLKFQITNRFFFAFQQLNIKEMGTGCWKLIHHYTKSVWAFLTLTRRTLRDQVAFFADIGKAVFSVCGAGLQPRSRQHFLNFIQTVNFILLIQKFHILNFFFKLSLKNIKRRRQNTCQTEQRTETRVSFTWVSNQ